MRTTLDIADDVVPTVDDRARRQKQPFFGFEPLPPRGEPVSNELIDKLREDDLG